MNRARIRTGPSISLAKQRRLQRARDDRNAIVITMYRMSGCLFIPACYKKVCATVVTPRLFNLLIIASRTYTTVGKEGWDPERPCETKYRRFLTIIFEGAICCYSWMSSGASYEFVRNSGCFQC